MFWLKTAKWRRSASVLWTTLQGQMLLRLFIDTAIGSAIGVAFNYTMLSRLIFQQS
jgi:hypothetical protein